MSARRIKTDRENKTEGEVQQDTSQISEKPNKRSTKGISDMYIFDKEGERDGRGGWTSKCGEVCCVSASCCGGVALHNSLNSIDHRLSLKSLRYFHLGFISTAWVMLSVSSLKIEAITSLRSSVVALSMRLPLHRRKRREATAHPLSTALTLQLHINCH